MSRVFLSRTRANVSSASLYVTRATSFLHALCAISVGVGRSLGSSTNVQTAGTIDLMAEALSSMKWEGMVTVFMVVIDVVFVVDVVSCTTVFSLKIGRDKVDLREFSKIPASP